MYKARLHMEHFNHLSNYVWPMERWVPWRVVYFWKETNSVILYSVEGIFFSRIYFFKLSTIITLIITFCIREIGTATGPCEGEWILWIWVVFHHYFDTNKLVIIVPLGYWPRFSCIGDFVNAFAVCIFKKFLPRVTFCTLIE